MTFASIPAGSAIFLDTNILVYHLTAASPAPSPTLPRPLAGFKMIGPRQAVSCFVGSEFRPRRAV
jgi:hypothetical protein